MSFAGGCAKRVATIPTWGRLCPGGIFSSASRRGIKTALPSVARVEMICITRISQVSVRPPPRLSRESSGETEARRRRTPVAINQRHAIRAVDACEFAEAWENIEPLERSLDGAQRQRSASNCAPTSKTGSARANGSQRCTPCAAIDLARLQRVDCRAASSKLAGCLARPPS